MWRYILLIVFFLPFGIQAQNQTKAKITVSGQITDSSGNPLPGVNVIVKNQSSLGVISDMDGNYMITKISPYDILVYSYMGFKSQEIPVDKRKVIKVIILHHNILGKIIRKCNIISLKKIMLNIIH